MPAIIGVPYVAPGGGGSAPGPGAVPPNGLLTSVGVGTTSPPAEPPSTGGVTGPVFIPGGGAATTVSSVAGTYVSYRSHIDSLRSRAPAAISDNEWTGYLQAGTVFDMSVHKLIGDSPLRYLPNGDPAGAQILFTNAWPGLWLLKLEYVVTGTPNTTLWTATETPPPTGSPGYKPPPLVGTPRPGIGPVTAVPGVTLPSVGQVKL